MLWNAECWLVPAPAVGIVNQSRYRGDNVGSHQSNSLWGNTHPQHNVCVAYRKRNCVVPTNDVGTCQISSLAACRFMNSGYRWFLSFSIIATKPNVVVDTAVEVMAVTLQTPEWMVCSRRRARWPLLFRAEKSWRYFGRFWCTLGRVVY